MAVHEERYQERVRSPRTAVLLALILGPIGMFYATITWAAIMLFMNIVFGLITYGLAILILWPVGARIAYKAVCARNQKLLRQRNDHAQPFSLSIEKHPRKLIDKNPGAVRAENSTRTISLMTQSNKIYMNGNALIKLGLGLIRKAETKWLPNGFISGFSKTEFTKKLSSFKTGKPSLLPNHALNSSEDVFGAFELRLIRLKKLRDKGLIDELEFNNKKKAILDEL
ncbi:MAG: SHOCT domain-containing protein [Desulfomonilaceae bacterium]|jgi:hypothetical protein